MLASTAIEQSSCLNDVSVMWPCTSKTKALSTVWILVSHHGNIQTIITRQAPVLSVSETEQRDKDQTVICLYTWWCVLYFYLHTDSRPADLHKAARCVYKEVCDTPAEPQFLLHVRSFNPRLFAVLLHFSAKIRVSHQQSVSPVATDCIYSQRQILSTQDQTCTQIFVAWGHNLAPYQWPLTFTKEGLWALILNSPHKVIVGREENL